jgi:hypothetical protein
VPAAGLRGLYPGRNMQLSNGGLPIVAATRRERLTEIYRRLVLAAPAASGTDAFDLIARTMNKVEDQLSGVPFDLRTGETMAVSILPSPIATERSRVDPTSYASAANGTTH